MVNFILKPWLFSGVYNWMILWIRIIHVAWHRSSDLAIRKVWFNPNKGEVQTIRCELEIAGTSSRADNYCKSRMQIPFSEPIQWSARGSLVLFKTKWRPKKINFHASFRVILAMRQHRPFQNIKTDGFKFKMLFEKECNILISSHLLSDTGTISLETCKSNKQTHASHSCLD